MSAVILRSWKLFGEADVPNSTIVRFMRSCLTDQPLQLYNAGRDPTLAFVAGLNAFVARACYLATMIF